MREDSIAMALGVAWLASPAIAGTASGSMTVSAVIEPSCIVDASPIIFSGGNEVIADTRANSAINLTCTPGAGYSVVIDGGRNAAGAQRRLISETGDGYLDYEIYIDAALTRRWSKGVSGAVAGVAPRSGDQVAIPAYAKVLSRTARAGRYSDVVTITVDF